MEARLARTNRKFRYTKPVKALRREATRAFGRGINVQLFGHFHTLWTYSEGQNSAMVVPAWLETRQALIVEDDGNWYGVDENLRPIEFTENGANGD